MMNYLSFFIIVSPLCSIFLNLLGQTLEPPVGNVQQELLEPYESPSYARIPFGVRSYYLTPWRAYMDTWPVSRWFEILGICLQQQRNQPTIQLLSEAGFTAVRMEWGWGHLKWNNQEFSDESEKKSTMQLLRKFGIRPIILLNAHHGGPCPLKKYNVRLQSDAPQGSREVWLAKEDLHKIRVQYTGFTNLKDYKAAFPLITNIDYSTGKVSLSAPLPVQLKQGSIQLTELRFQPLAGKVYQDGTLNPAAEETLRGWIDYVATVCRVAKEGLGTEGLPDAGFDVEVWNEYTFGSDFLDINRYYHPKLQFKEPLQYRSLRTGEKQKGSECLLLATIDYIRDPNHRCPGVRVISGFSNQRPWDALSTRWLEQTGISRHYYNGTDVKIISSQNPDHPTSGPVNKIGKREGTSDRKDWHTVLSGSFFIPNQRWALPEWWHYGIKTEFITRDVQPFPSTDYGPISFSHHFRYGHPGDWVVGEVWRTETNIWRWPMAERLIRETGCKPGDSRLVELMHQLASRWVLRMFLMNAHKGEKTNTLYKDGPDDLHFGFFPSSYETVLREEGGVLTDRVRQTVGPQYQVIARVSSLFRGGEPMDVARKLTVQKLVEHNPRLVWKGNGTPENPDRYHRDDFAVLPFQHTSNRFIIGYYVVTHDITSVKRSDREWWDPYRYLMDEQTFDLTLGNVRGEEVQVRAWDPVEDRSVPVQVINKVADAVTLRIISVDYPRFLVLEEKEVGPLLHSVTIQTSGKNQRIISFIPNQKGEVTVSWGPYPARVPYFDGVKKGQIFAEYYADDKFEKLLGCRLETQFQYTRTAPFLDQVPYNPLSSRWITNLIPPVTGEYKFVVRGEGRYRLSVQDQYLVDEWKNVRRGIRTTISLPIQLKVGQPVQLCWEWRQEGGFYEEVQGIFWIRPGMSEQNPEPIPFQCLQLPELTKMIKRGGIKQVPVDAFKISYVELSNVHEEDAIALQFRSGKIVYNWPQWMYDLRGTLKDPYIKRSKDPSSSASSPHPNSLTARIVLPPLSQMYQFKTIPRLETSLPNLTILGQIMQGEIPDILDTLLPVLAPSDQIRADIKNFDQLRGWQIGIEWDQTMHPDQRYRYQTLWVFPLHRGVYSVIIQHSAPLTQDFIQSIGKQIQTHLE